MIIIYTERLTQLVTVTIKIIEDLGFFLQLSTNIRFKPSMDCIARTKSDPIMSLHALKKSLLTHQGLGFYLGSEP